MISAGIDGELNAQQAALLDAHLKSCAECHAQQEMSWDLKRRFSFAAASSEMQAQQTAVPTELRSSWLPIPATSRLEGFLRWVLFVIGSTLAILNARTLIFAELDPEYAHVIRHDAVWGCALGIAMVVVWLKPHRARGLLPLTAALTVLHLAVTAIDLARRQADAMQESSHLVALVGLVCLWVISGGSSKKQR